MDSVCIVISYICIFNESLNDFTYEAQVEENSHPTPVSVNNYWN